MEGDLGITVVTDNSFTVFFSEFRGRDMRGKENVKTFYYYIYNNNFRSEAQKSVLKNCLTVICHNCYAFGG